MGPYERGCGVTSAEQRGPSVCNVSFNREGKDEMTKASIDLQDLRRRLYVKAKAETSWRFWGLYVHVCKLETLRKAYALAKNNDGAPGIDGVAFAAIEAEGVEAFLGQIRDELGGAHLCTVTGPAAAHLRLPLRWRRSAASFPEPSLFLRPGLCKVLRKSMS